MISLFGFFFTTCVCLCVFWGRSRCLSRRRASSIVPRRLESVALEHRKDGGGRKRNESHLRLPRRPVAVSVATDSDQRVYIPRACPRWAEGVWTVSTAAPPLQEAEGRAGRLAVRIRRTTGSTRWSATGNRPCGPVCGVRRTLLSLVCFELPQTSLCHLTFAGRGPGRRWVRTTGDGFCRGPEGVLFQPFWVLGRTVGAPCVVVAVVSAGRGPFV